MSEWLNYTDTVEKHTVVGDLRVWKALYSPQFGNTRDILVWLPPAYASDQARRFPVLYMHDGQNIFDEYTSYAGEWRVDETMTELAAEGDAAIVVGIPNMGDTRIQEYNPYPDPRFPAARGNDYIRFMIETVKPLIDASFRTLPDAPNTGLAGSSMGGLISMHGFLTHPEVFGFCGAFSTAFWFGERQLEATVRQRGAGHGRLYHDIGTAEGHILQNVPDADNRYFHGVRQLQQALLEVGYREGENLMYVEDRGARHHESDWARRLPAALRFLLPKRG
ncbi:MAG: alpha/beta hydrolase [Anaerolineae bacterium]